MKNNYHWILLGIAVGIVFYLIDKYIFKMRSVAKVPQFWAWCYLNTILLVNIAALGY